MNFRFLYKEKNYLTTWATASFVALHSRYLCCTCKLRAVTHSWSERCGVMTSASVTSATYVFSVKGWITSWHRTVRLWAAKFRECPANIPRKHTPTRVSPGFGSRHASPLAYFAAELNTEAGQIPYAVSELSYSHDIRKASRHLSQMIGMTAMQPSCAIGSQLIKCHGLTARSMQISFYSVQMFWNTRCHAAAVCIVLTVRTAYVLCTAVKVTPGLDLTVLSCNVYRRCLTT